MNLELNKIIAGAVSGLLAAVLVDVDAWRSHKGPDPFNWGLAFKRWLVGAISGALAGAGIQAQG